MSLTLSKRADSIVQAEIRVMTIECDKVGGINLAQGVCDVGVPQPVARGAQIAIDDGINCYTRYDGLAELRRAIAQKVRAFNKIEADPETDRSRKCPGKSFLSWRWRGESNTLLFCQRRPCPR
ncbi:MAG: hypothetical protein A2170_14410 [Deltaproteobacteria bacterium RBG_13_53_10]|nr:MAG: hypothetical protein A2170_14410 [Deltaproteobacteria bacterium RBG_13_53_10]